jgi:hypothetical protein
MTRRPAFTTPCQLYRKRHIERLHWLAMDKVPAFDRTGGRWRGTVPVWWFGAPLIATLYVFLTPRVLPDIVPETASMPLVRWLVGLVIGVAILSIWQIARWRGRVQ